MHHIPAVARNEVAATLARVLQNFRDRPGWESLQQLLAFPKVVLHVLDRSGNSHWAVVGATIHDRARAYLAEPLSQTWRSTLARKTSMRQLSTRVQAKDQEAMSKGFIAGLECMVADGCLSKACRHLTTGLVNVSDPGVLDQLQALHPSEPHWTATRPLFGHRLEFTEDDEDTAKGVAEAVLHAVRSFPTGSAPGPTGLRPDHLRELLDDATGGPHHPAGSFLCMGPGGWSSARCCAILVQCGLNPIAETGTAHGSPKGTANCVR